MPSVLASYDLNWNITQMIKVRFSSNFYRLPYTVSVNKKRSMQNGRKFLLTGPIPFIFGYVALQDWQECTFMFFKAFLEKYFLVKIFTHQKITRVLKIEKFAWMRFSRTTSVIWQEHGVICVHTDLSHLLECSETAQIICAPVWLILRYDCQPVETHCDTW